MNKQKNDEVRQKTLEYFEGNELLTNIWLSKYCLKDKSGTYLEETPYERIEAVIREVVRIDMKHYYEYATTEGPLPDLPIMKSMRRDSLKSIENCYMISGASSLGVQYFSV